MLIPLLVDSIIFNQIGYDFFFYTQKINGGWLNRKLMLQSYGFFLFVFFTIIHNPKEEKRYFSFVILVCVCLMHYSCVTLATTRYTSYGQSTHVTSVVGSSTQSLPMSLSSSIPWRTIFTEYRSIVIQRCVQKKNLIPIVVVSVT